MGAQNTVVPPSSVRVDDERLRSALGAAHIPTLLMVLLQLTGDARWSSARYQPDRPKGMSDPDSGGLPDEVQQEIREAAFEAIAAWHRGGASLRWPLPDDEFADMMSFCVGETVPAEYATMMAEEMGLEPRFGDAQPGDPRADHPDVIIVGAGLSGLCAAIQLRNAGFSSTIIDKNPSVGGTWFANGYPGCGVDTPGHLYSFSFQQPDLERYYTDRASVLAYLEQLAADSGLAGDVRYRTFVRAARYDPEAHRWSVDIEEAGGRSETLTAAALIVAVGQLSRPKLPDIPGMQAFSGRSFHTAEWPADADIDGKRVAVVGTGASAMQVVPAIASRVSKLVVFQRSPQWVAPNENYRRPVTDDERLLFSQVPGYAAWYRMRLAWMFGDRIYPSLRVDPDWPQKDRSINAANERHRQWFTEHIVRELGDRQDLVDAVVPTYPPFGKRMLIDNGWFRALTRPNVDLVVDPIDAVTPDGIVAAGTNHDVDVIVYATGFDTLQMLGPVEIVGRRGRSLREVWGPDDARAYLGLTVPEFPNLFCLYGPNTNVGHGGSLIFLTECQVRYVIEVLKRMRQDDLAAVECRRDVHDAFNEQVDAAHERLIWTHPGMENYYRNRQGRVVTNWPWRLLDYWRMTRQPDFDDFVVTPRSGA